MEFLAPAISYLLASKSAARQKIQRLYTQARKREDTISERTEKLLAQYDMPELESTLTQEGRLRYKQALFCMLSENGGIDREEAIFLLEKAYPGSVIAKRPDDIGLGIPIGTYETKDAGVAVLLLALRKMTLPIIESTVFDAWIGLLKLAALVYMPLPYWPGKLESEKTAGKIERSIGKLTNKACYFYTDEIADSVARNISSCVKMDKQKKDAMTLMCTYAPARLPSVEELMDMAEEEMPSFAFLTKESLEDLKLFLSDKRVEERSKRVKAASDPGRRREFLLAEFARQCLSMGPVSMGEIYDTEISWETAERIKGAYAITFNDEESRGLSKDPVAAFLGTVVLSLANRAYSESRVNAVLIEEAAKREQRLAEFEAQVLKVKELENAAAVDEEALTAAKQETQSLKKEVSKLKMKNSGLSAEIKDIREKKEEDVLKLRAENESLKREYEKIKHEMDEILAAMEDDDEDNETAGSDTSSFIDEADLDAMCHYINENRLIFVGGHTSWQDAMRRLFPGAKFAKKESYMTLSKDFFRNADYIIYNYKWSKHSLYRKCKAYADDGVPMIMLSTNNTDFSVRRIYDSIQDYSKRKAG